MKIKEWFHLAWKTAIALIVLFAVLDLIGLFAGNVGAQVKAFIFNPVRTVMALTGIQGPTSTSSGG